jgi:hypothetical protein
VTAPDELLERLAGELRRTVGPAVEEPFARTQAFMAAVILERLSRQLRSADACAAADRVARPALVAELRARLGPTPAAHTAAAVAALDAAAAEGDPGDAGLAEVVAALWADRGELGDEQFGELLAIVRRALRARLDRELEYSA